MKKALFLLFVIPFLALSQNQIQGIVTDSKTKKALPFASVTTNTGFGVLTDTDGKFYIQTKDPFTTIKISYIGYTTLEIPLNNYSKFLKIKLNSSVENLNEILIKAKENPALGIIRNTIKNKPINNIEKALNTYQFNSYNKILVTANPDSINGKIDSVFFVKKGEEKKFLHVDSSNYKFKKDIIKQHLFISEKISEYKFQKGKKQKEVVLASRMAGLKQPIYELLAITFQDLSFYKEFYTLAGTKYTNPIANNALKKYNYKILDTINNANGKSIIIHFKQKEVKQTLGLEGVLYIDTKQFAITKAIVELKGLVNVKATQNYKYLKQFNIWFPSNMDIVLKKGENKENIALFGGAVKFSESKKNDSIINTNTKNESDVTYFISKTSNSNIHINTPVSVKKSATTIQFNDDAHKKSAEFWNLYRTDTLTQRGENTYSYLDSIAKTEGVEKKINFARNILKGYFPTKYINLNLGKILNLNNYEGVRLGFGGETNSNFSNVFKIESYIAYGTKDKDFKYSIGASTRLNKNNNTWIGGSFTNDLKEAAALDFIKENNSFSPINPRNLNIDKFYNYKIVKAFITHDIQPNLEAKFQVSTGNYLPVFEYQFNSLNKNLIDYKLTLATLGFQYNPKNEYMNSPVGKLKIKNVFPQFTFQLTKSFENLLQSDFNFTQISLRVLHKIHPIKKATTTILAEGGIVFGDTPISHLFNATPNYTFKNPWIKRITFAGKNSFETMSYNEFISDKFAALHIKHQLTPFNISKKFKPQLTLVSRVAIGKIDNPEYHSGLIFKGLNKAYLESGLEFNGLFKGFGLSSFYRYGVYKNVEWSDNLAIKLTYKFRLGF
ncbi:DUF5686 and carboxypeptidase regulatory-like domain-containing protein [Lutibacter sp. A80]|uniref:DUF5686 and carboxypeptidase-like regulatory domain-containing protein n=1 Tax=Lutibacter sp. A80 TaxID=2918453 RepID=UPI001F062775|nr:DUF5686 and carboxypeptidase-like regulatory domain-containing protein [Lutibacter sp. A80]UMB60020.1 DUF5686 and carboxypeptidase regulatory-like domain-containing protein [Lutibacter sp. A80]